ncbi:MAG: hypothetical protein ASARMPRED_007687 [Alectoria sarmentosa]|nr:MAG: hypothetical protein ASARMPRED_007687 [Alectoria sarmentosa]
MSSPTFMSLPLEIRNRIYDFVWDLGQMVSISGWSSKYVPRSLRKIHPFDSNSADVTLALLHVNHQISAEAASTFYGKRKFYFGPNQLMPFLKGIVLRRHLIREVEVMETSSFDLRFPPQAFDLLRNLDRLRSFTMIINTKPFEYVHRHLVNAGIYRLTDRLEVTVHSERGITLYDKDQSILPHGSEYVVFRNNWTCAKGEREFKSQGFHCKGSGRLNEENIWEHESSQPCDHDHHRLGWDIATNGS